MRRASVGVFAAALGVAAPVAAKGPAWKTTTLEEPRDLGGVVLARGDAAFYESGAPAYGTLEKPLALSARVTLPKGTLVHFSNTNATGGPPYPLFGAALPGPFSACGVEFLPNADPYAILLSLGPIVPKGYTLLGVYGSVPIERSEHHDPLTLTGPLLHPMELAGFQLPAGSTISFACEGAAPEFGGWTGEFERDTDVGGLVLRARTPSSVAFAMFGPHVVTGTLAKPGELYERLLPAGTRFADYPSFLIATCPDSRVSLFREGTWNPTDCGTAVASETSSQGLDVTSEASLRPRRVSARIPWTFIAFGVAAFFVSLTLPLFLIRRSAPKRT